MNILEISEPPTTTDALRNATEASHGVENLLQAIFKSLLRDYEVMKDKAAKKLVKVQRTSESTVHGSSNAQFKDIEGSFVPWKPVDGNSVLLYKCEFIESIKPEPNHPLLFHYF